MKITVFTPTYNRGYIIENLYRSLCRQSFKDFEWLVVDDGSTDNTEQLIAHFQREQPDFPIRYFFKQNGGKCSAINDALDLAAGELFFTVDSDDFLTDDALKKISLWESQLPKGKKYCGVAGNLGTSPDETRNSLFQDEYFEGTLLDRYNAVDGERAMAFYTDVHRKYPYPLFEGEKFMTEAVAWNRMANDGYKMRFFNDIIWIYEYKEDGLTKAGSSVFLNNPKGYGLWLREKAEFEHASFKERLKLCYTFTCDLSNRISTKEIAECIGANHVLITACRFVHNLLQLIRR